MSRLLDEFLDMVDKDFSSKTVDPALIDALFPLPDPKVIYMQSMPRPPVAPEARPRLQ